MDLKKMALMKKMMAEKKDKSMSKNESSAKKSALSDLSSLAGSMMGDKLKGLKKVTVASDSPEGVSKGLDIAKKLADSKEPEGMDHENSESEESEGQEESKAEEVAMSCSECDANQLQEVISKLQEMLDAKSEGSGDSKSSIFPA